MAVAELAPPATLVPSPPQATADTASLPPLSGPQRKLVLGELAAYFHGGFHARGYPYQQPTFRAEVQWYDRDNLPEDVSAGHVMRRAPGAVPDPTYWQAATLIFGPGKVPVWRGERVAIQAEEFKRMARFLPTHLSVPFRRCILPPPRQRTTFIDMGQELQISRNTVSAYCDQAIAVLASWLYAERWPAEE